MRTHPSDRSPLPRGGAGVVRKRSLALGLAALAACAPATSPATPAPAGGGSIAAPSPDPRIGLRSGRSDAEEAAWNLRVLSRTPSPTQFASSTNSDLAFTGKYAIQGSFNGYQVWDISNPNRPALVKAYFCPASQSDVSVYRDLLFVSGEAPSARLDCGAQGVRDTVSAERLRGLRIFDIRDIRNPRYLSNVQTCRGSHTHTLLVDPSDTENVYVYVSGTAAVRSPSELPGCVSAGPERDPNSALFRIEVVKVPLAHPEQAAIVSSPRIFNDLTAPPVHGESPADVLAAARVAAAARDTGAFTATVAGVERVVAPAVTRPLLDSLVRARNGSGAPTAADSAVLRAALTGILERQRGAPGAPRPGPTQCHDITVYPAIGLAGGACAGYGFLLDIRDPAHPTRLTAVADSNFSYWHSATFNNDGTRLLFSDEWGGGTQPKCRATDRREWGSDAIFTIASGEVQFQSYYKLPAPQTPQENCVAHNGSLIPIPGRDVMVQSWYQGGISVFDWSDARNPREIAYFDRGPIDATRLVLGGSWSAYWYNGVIVSSEIARGLDVLELTPSALLSQNEIDAAKTVRLDYLNPQGQPKFVWPATFSLARAYVDQLARGDGLPAGRIAALRPALAAAEGARGGRRRDALLQLAAQLDGEASGSADGARVRTLAGVVRALGDASR
jgi:hypothetical protein